MADLKELLGDDYKEGMSLEEINKALKSKEFVDKGDYVPKSSFDKASSDLAKLKKELKAATSNLDAQQIEEQMKQEALQEELTQLRRTTKVADFKAKYLGMSYAEDKAQQLAEALADGEMDTVFKIQKEHNDNLAKVAKDNAMKDMNTPPAGQTNNVNYANIASEAIASGNTLAAIQAINQQAAEVAATQEE